MNATALQITTSMSEFRARTTAHDSSSLSAALNSVWSGLINGRLTVTGTAISADSATLWVRPREATRNQPRAARVFENVAGGEAQKVVAIDTGVAPSTVAAMLRSVLDGMGLRCSFSQLPLAIPLLYHATAHPELATLRCEVDCASHKLPGFVVRLRRCEWSVAPELSESEYQVIRLLLEGHAYRQIASSRRTAVRTIANQISAAYKKLGVNSRFDLLRSAVEAAVLNPLNPQRASAETWPPPLRMLAPLAAHAQARSEYSQAMSTV